MAKSHYQYKEKQALLVKGNQFEEEED